jgi:hypothetical protein
MGAEKVKMPGRTLKLHDEYLQRLELYAEASKLTVEYKQEDGDGAYVPSRRLIRIDPDLNDSFQVAVFLHELGHHLDDRLVHEKYLDRVNKAYTAFYAEKHTKRHLKLIRETEERAWEYGRTVAKIVKIRLGKWYDDAQKLCLESYK